MTKAKTKPYKWPPFIDLGLCYPLAGVNRIVVEFRDFGQASDDVDLRAVFHSDEQVYAACPNIARLSLVVARSRFIQLEQELLAIHRWTI